MTTINSEAVERVARELAKADGVHEAGWPVYVSRAKAAFAALTAPTPADDVVEQVRGMLTRRRLDAESLGGAAEIDVAEIDEALAALAFQQARIAALAKTVVALADGADKCAEPPHHIVQPFLAIYREHGETIAEARALLNQEPSK